DSNARHIDLRMPASSSMTCTVCGGGGGGGGDCGCAVALVIGCRPRSGCGSVGALANMVGLPVRQGQGKVNGDSRSIGVADSTNASAVAFHDGSTDAQPDPQALRLGGVKRLEQPLFLRLIQPAPAVTHA